MGDLGDRVRRGNQRAGPCGRSGSGDVPDAVLYTVLVGAAFATGVVLGVVGGVASNGEMASNGWAIATFAAFVGAMVRLGYNIGLRAGPDRTEEQLAQLLESVNHVERVVTGGQPRGVVSQLRRRPPNGE